MPNNNEQGYKTKTKLAHWNPILEYWFSYLKAYCDAFENEAPYFYGERPNIGLFSAAAWKANFIALEEFSHPKRGQKHSRCDLWIYQKGRRYKDDLIEAKQAWSINSAEKKLKEAQKDAHKIRKHNDYNRIGLLFLSHGIHKIHESEVDFKIQGLIKIAKNIDNDALAWFFPSNKRYLTGGGRYKHIYHPGVILIAKGID
jgi:hypothetical protein